MVEMVAFAMVVSPRGLACGASLTAAAVEYRRLAMARELGARMPALHKSRVAQAPASRRSFASHAALSRGSNNLCSRLPVQVSWRRHAEKSFIRAAAVEEPPEMTKKRLSRDERAALVKSFVQKFASENKGEFPSLSVVLKETGGSRAVVKDILTELQSSLTVKVEVASTPATEGAPSRVEAGDTAKVSSSAAAAVSESEEEDDSDEDDGDQDQGEKAEKPTPPPSSSQEEKITSLKRTIGETPGEINNTYTDILSRLKSLGKKDEPAVKAQAAEVGAPETEEVKKPSFAARILPPRHGVFVRFLHPAATEEDLRKAFGDCGEISRASVVKPMKPTAKFTYGFIDFQTAEGLTNALRKTPEILGSKVETEVAPTQNSQLPDVAPKVKEPQAAGSGLIDNLVQKVVSIVPPNPDNNKNQMPRVWNGQDAPRFNQQPGMNTNKGGPDFKPKGMGYQRNDMPLPPRGEAPSQFRGNFPPRNDNMPPRMDMPPPRMDGPPPPLQQPGGDFMPRQLPRNDNGGFVPPIPPLTDLQKLRRDLAVCVENLLPSTNISQLKDALSLHGEIYATYLKNRDMNSSSYYFEYLTDEGKENALSAHWVHINGQMVRISRAELPKTTVVRVANVSPSTPDGEFINACKSCGQVERVESRRDRVRDVFYHPAESRNMIKILDRLNEITINQCRWHAKPAPRCTINMLNRPEGVEFICHQMKVLLRNQESMLQQLQIEQRDLRELSMYAMEMLQPKK